MKLCCMIFLTWTSFLCFVYAKNMDEIEVLAAESAIKFSSKWLASPNPHINLMLPSQILSKSKDVVKLTRKMSEVFKRNIFLRIVKENNKYHPKNELFWYPFEISNYDSICQYVDTSDRNETLQNHFLFFGKTKKDVIFSLRYCNVRFDSNVVIYYYRNNNNFLWSEIIFEEVYKMEKHQKKFRNNVLCKVDLKSNRTGCSGLELFVWKRRRNLHGTQFTAITEHEYPFIDLDDNSNGILSVYPRGYYSDIMKHLMLTLNFTINVTIPQTRQDWEFLVQAIGANEFDIGYAYFIFTRSRYNLVDFSFGINKVFYMLFYVRKSNEVNIDVFIKPFHAEAWYSILVYATVLISGIILVSLMVKFRSESSNWKTLVYYFIKGTNFAIRSLIGKRMSSEPNRDSTRISFFILVLFGFVVITLYRAVLVAFVTIEIETPPVRSLQEVGKSKYHLAIKQATVVDDMFTTASPGSARNELHKDNKILRFPDGTSDFLDKMANENSNASNSILFYDNSLVYKQSKHFPCTITHVHGYKRDQKETGGMVFKKNWAYTRFLNYHLLVMKEKGILDRLFEPYLKVTKKSCPKQQTIRHVINKPRPVGLNTTFSLYLLVLTGFIGAAMCLMVELVPQYCDKGM